MYDYAIDLLKRDLSFTYGDQITSYNSGYICDVFSEIADSNVDIYYSDLFEWAKDNIGYIDEATEEFGNPNDLIKQIQQGEFYAYEQDLYENQNSVLKLFAYNYLKDNDIVLDEDDLDDLDNYVEHLESDDRLEDIIDYCKYLSNDLEVA